MGSGLVSYFSRLPTNDKSQRSGFLSLIVAICVNYVCLGTVVLCDLCSNLQRFVECRLRLTSVTVVLIIVEFGFRNSGIFSDGPVRLAFAL